MKEYINAELQIIMLNDANVITASGGGDSGNDNPFGDIFGTKSGSNPWDF